MLQHVGVSFPVKQLFLLRFLVLMTAALQMKMKRLSLFCRLLCSFWETVLDDDDEFSISCRCLDL